MDIWMEVARCDGKMERYLVWKDTDEDDDSDYIRWDNIK
jgi:hypothetical protein